MNKKSAVKCNGGILSTLQITKPKTVNRAAASCQTISLKGGLSGIYRDDVTVTNKICSSDVLYI